MSDELVDDHRFYVSGGGIARPGAVIMTCYGCSAIVVTLPPGTIGHPSLFINAAERHNTHCSEPYDEWAMTDDHDPEDL